ncbi:MAG: ferritin family protein [Bradymonadales bacterium]|nr:ferritin family protein [Bradymonadales bacterium]
MKKFGSVDEILDFAISREEAAAQFYTHLAQRVNRTWMQEIFRTFAKEEEGHKATLLAFKEGKSLEPMAQKVLDLKIGDYLVDVEVTSDMDYQQALIVAMKREKASYRLYTDLANRVEDAGLKATLERLAQEEAKHKLRFEVEYDEVILADN